MKTILITITRGSLVRNFFHTGVISRLLAAGLRVVIATPFSERKDIFAPYAHDRLLIAPLQEPLGVTSFRGRILKELRRGAIFNSTIRARYRYRFTKAGAPPRALYYPRLFFLSPLSWIPGVKTFVRLLERWLDPARENDALLRTYRPDLVFSTSPMEGADGSVLKGAKRLRLKTVSMPKSWDNPSKILFPVKTDALLVWSPFMKAQTLRYQGYREHEIVMTGAPQFDIYARTGGRMSREEFCRNNRLDPEKRILLYGSTGSNVCYEAHYLDLIKKFMRDGALQNTQVFIRPHVGYRDDYKQFEPLTEDPLFVLDRHDKQDETLKDNWDVSPEHMEHLADSLFHADVCINVASTLAIDAVISGTPVVNICFDVDPRVDPEMSVPRLYKSDYIEAIVRSGGTNVARSEQEFLTALQDALSQKAPTRAMEEFVAHFAYKADGGAAERIAENLISMVQA